MNRGCMPRIYLNLGCLGFGCLTTLAAWAAAVTVAAAYASRKRNHR